MTADTILASLQLSTPEIILAVGGLVLLMIGVFSGERSGTTVTGLAVALLIIAGLWLVLATGDLAGVSSTANFDVVLEKPFSGVRMENAVISALHHRESAA